MTSTGNEPTDVAEPQPRVVSLRAHLAGVEHSENGPTLWLSDEQTTMHFPLTPSTVPALLGQLAEVEQDQLPARERDDRRYDDELDGWTAPATQPAEEDEPEPTGRLSRWTGWHYSNALVSRIPARQRITLFAAVLVILLLITLFTR